MLIKTTSMVPWKICKLKRHLIFSQNAGSGVGPKNNRSIFCLPITRTSSRAVQYTRISRNRIICTAQ